MHPRKFVRDALGATLGQFVARIILLLRGLVSAAALGPLGTGGWNALGLVLDYGQYASFGALQGLELRLPPAVAQGERERATLLMAGTWTTMVLGALLSGVVLTVYLMTGDRAIEGLWGWPAPALMLAAAVLQLAILYHVAALRAHGEFQRTSAALVAQALIGGGIGIALVFRFGVWALLVGWLAGSVAALLWMRVSRQPVPLTLMRPREGLALARGGLPIFAYFTLTLVLRSLDRIAFVHFGRTEALGHYSLGLMAAGMVQYLPEAAGAVLYPRIAAAWQGAGDAERTRAEVTQVHRAIAVLLPLAVGVALPWAGVVTAWLLPAFQEGVPALRLLSIGMLLLGAATVPSYWLLGAGDPRRHLAIAAVAVVVTGTLVFGAASRDPRPETVALAASLGYAVFAAGLVGLTGNALFARGGERMWFVLASFVPTLWVGVLVLGWARLAPAATANLAALGSAVVTLGYLPVLWVFGRGIGLRKLAQEWLAARVVAA